MLTNGDFRALSRARQMPVSRTHRAARGQCEGSHQGHKRRLQQTLRLIDARRAALYAPPPTANPTVEAEIRARYANMNKAQRDHLHGAMAAGQNDLALGALLNDPLMLGDEAKFLKSLWAPRVEKEHAGELARLDEDKQEYSNALAGCGGLHLVLERVAPPTRPPRKTEDLTYGASA
jgi:hypothetical protein